MGTSVERKFQVLVFHEYSGWYHRAIGHDVRQVEPENFTTCYDTIEDQIMRWKKHFSTCAKAQKLPEIKLKFIIFVKPTITTLYVTATPDGYRTTRIEVENDDIVPWIDPSRA